MYASVFIDGNQLDEEERCNKARTGFLPLYEVKVGDVFEVYRGDKYPIGTQFAVTGIYQWGTPHGTTTVDYLIGDGIKVAKRNCRFVKGYSEV